MKGEFLMDILKAITQEQIRTDLPKLEIGDTVTVRGTCTDVGEVMGYSLDIEEIK